MAAGDRQAPAEKGVDYTSLPGEQTEATAEGQFTFNDSNSPSPSQWAEGHDAHDHFVSTRNWYPEDGLDFLASKRDIRA